MPIRSDGEETRNRILQAAGEIFGKYGYHKATNQEISTRCGVNSAAISYYFRDKAGLYREAWIFLQNKSAEKYLSWIGPVEEQENILLKGVAREMELVRLRRLSRSLFDWMHDEGCWDSEILRYEITKPTGLLESPEHDAVVWVIKTEIKESLSRLLSVAAGSMSVILGTQGLVARFRDYFQVDRADLGLLSLEEYFELVYISFLKSLDLTESRNASKNVKRTATATDHPELGVTDEVDPFVLKPLTHQDLLIMKKTDDVEKKTVIQKEEQHIADADNGEDSHFLQQELW